MQNQTMTRTKQQIEEAKEKYSFMSNVLDEIFDCYKNHDCPEEPSGPSTNAGNIAFLTNDPSDMGEDVSIEDMEANNNATVALFECCGFVHIGGNTWHNQYKPDKKWSDFQNDAYAIAKEYMDNSYWDDFCAWRWAI